MLRLSRPLSLICWQEVKLRMTSSKDLSLLNPSLKFCKPPSVISMHLCKSEIYLVLHFYSLKLILTILKDPNPLTISPKLVQLSPLILSQLVRSKVTLFNEVKPLNPSNKCPTPSLLISVHLFERSIIVVYSFQIPSKVQVYAFSWRKLFEGLTEISQTFICNIRTP